jgi:hypothetical protein
LSSLVDRRSSGPGPFASLTVGVGHLVMKSVSVSPECAAVAFLRLTVELRVDFESPRVGVGIRWLTARPSSLPLGPGRRACPSFGIPCGVGHRSPRKFRGGRPPVRRATALVLLASGVGNDPEAVAPVRGADGGSRNAVPLRVIPARGQVGEHSTESPRKERWNVLHEDVPGSKLANDSSELGPKTRALAVEACAESGEREVLARKPATDEVDGGEVGGADGADVGMSNSVRESRCKHGPSVRVLLDLPARREPRAFEAEVESSDPGKERADIHHRPRSRS